MTAMAEMVSPAMLTVDLEIDPVAVHPELLLLFDGEDGDHSVNGGGHGAVNGMDILELGPPHNEPPPPRLPCGFDHDHEP